MTFNRALSAMASVSNELNATLKALLYAVCMILVGVVGWALVDGIMADRAHAMRITALESNEYILGEINRRLGVIEQQLRDGR